MKPIYLYLDQGVFDIDGEINILERKELYTEEEQKRQEIKLKAVVKVDKDTGNVLVVGVEEWAMKRTIQENQSDFRL